MKSGSEVGITGGRWRGALGLILGYDSTSGFYRVRIYGISDMTFLYPSCQLERGQ